MGIEMKNTEYKLCLNCFCVVKGDYEVCPYCGYIDGDLPKAAFYLRQGSVLKDRYIIGTVLGYGGFGITYKAYDTVLSMVVAIKELYPFGLVNRAEDSSNVCVFSGCKTKEFMEIEKRFVEEAHSMALFSKEKDIVNVYAYFQENGTEYIIMEYIDGILLKTYLRKKGRIPEEQACDYLCSLLNALTKIHEQGIVHKDVSADNIFLVSSGQVKLVDFGAARLQDSDNKYTTIVKSGYAPPEQYRSKVVADHRTDIYAAGAVMYQMLTGECPTEALERIVEDHLEGINQKGIKIRHDLDKVIMKALSLNPDERYESAATFREAVLQAEKKKSWKWWNERRE